MITSFGTDSVAEPDDEDGSDRDHRNGLRGHQQGIEGAAQDVEAVQDDGEDEAGHGGDEKAEDDLDQRGRGVVGQQLAIAPQGLADVAGRRHQERLDPERVSEQIPPGRKLPQGDQGGDDDQRGEQAPHRAASSNAASARSRLAVNAAEVTVSSRGVERGAGAASVATTRAGRAESTSTRSAR